MKTYDTDRVREYARREYIVPARERGESTVRIIAGEVHRALGLHNRVPLVCSALSSREFLQKNRLRIQSRVGPPSLTSTTVTFTYRLEPDKHSGAASHPFYSLRGIAKEVFRELGGGDTFIRAERDQFRDS
jgi:hypothetical protein